MATLNDMLLAELIKIGDTIEFTFKGNTFRAKILRGGLIGKCQQQSIHDKEPVSVLETKEHKTINNILHESYEETSSFISKKVLLGYKPHPDYETTYSRIPITSLLLLRNSTFYQPGILPAGWRCSGAHLIPTPVKNITNNW